ncbi:MAG: hypothetical protein ACQEWV_02915 [Bacillota bacterium]
MNGKVKAIVKHHRGYGAQIQTVEIPQINEDEVKGINFEFTCTAS